MLTGQHAFDRLGAECIIEAQEADNHVQEP